MIFIKKIDDKIYSIFLLTIMLIAGCTDNKNNENNNGKIKISVTFYPLYEITKSIAGDKAEVTSIIPNGVEPHDYDPTPSQIVGISGSKLIVVLGEGFENVENKMTINKDKYATIVNATSGILLMQADPNSDETGGIDPHVWVSPRRMQIIANNIKSGLQKVDPQNAETYENNAKQYIKKLEDLDSSYKQGLANCSKNIILTSHAAFAYLGKDYGFKQLAISGLSPDAEPSPQKIVELIEAAKNNNISYIFYEELVDPRIADTISKEVGAKIMQLSPIEGTKNSNDDYFSIMQRNLNNLRIARGCF